jgi:hypothetical protein
MAEGVVMLIENIFLDAAPQFTHDCENCECRGQVYDKVADFSYDVYECAGDDPSIVLRFGNDGPEYYSFPRSSAEVVASGAPDSCWALAMRLVKAHEILRGEA